jgi:hypothetical protein
MGQKTGPFTNTNSGAITFNETQDQILVMDSNQIPRIVIGLLPDGTYGMVVSKPGINVLNVF